MPEGRGGAGSLAAASTRGAGLTTTRPSTAAAARTDAEQMLAAAQEREAALNGLLTAQQGERLRQISRQVRGVFAFNDPDVIDALDLTDEQKEFMRVLMSRVVAANAFPAMRRHGGGGPGGGPGGEGSQRRDDRPDGETRPDEPRPDEPRRDEPRRDEPRRDEPRPDEPQAVDQPEQPQADGGQAAVGPGQDSAAITPEAAMQRALLKLSPLQLKEWKRLTGSPFDASRIPRFPAFGGMRPPMPPPR